MKKIRIFAVLGLIICALFALLAVGCGESLGTPGGFDIDENYKLSWSSVENARSYKVEVINCENGEKIEETSRKTSISLEYLKEGNYEIRVKALAGENSGNMDSPWSRVIDFEKGFETGCLYTLINNREYELTKIGSAAGDLVIEDVYRGKPVTSIAASAFKGSGNSRIESVVIGSNVRTIGEKAFLNCKNLKSVEIPSSVVFIGENAFNSCVSLESVVLPEAVTVINANTFAYCRAMKKVTFGSKVTSIGDGAFSNCDALETVVIPDTVVTLGPNVFYGSKGLKSITIGDNVTAIMESAFYKCVKLETVVFGDEGNLKKIENSAFGECDALVSITIPEGVTNVDDYAFNNASALLNVELPESITHIGVNAFSATKFYIDAINNEEMYIYADDWLIACPQKATLAEVLPEDIKGGVVGIADNTFVASPALAIVKIPLSVKYIGEAAFYNCPVLYRVTVDEGNSLIKIGANAFAHCDKLFNVQFAYGLQEIDSYAFLSCDLLDNNANDPTLLVPESVTRIGTWAFNETQLWTNRDESGVVYAGNWVVGYEDLNSANIQLREGTVGISDLGFYMCDTLQTVGRLGQVEHIGIAAFMGCSSLSSVTLNSNLKKIENYTFYGCTSLYEINMPRTLTSIGRSAFYGSGLAEVDLSRTRVETIGLFAFYGSENLRTVTFSDELTLIDDYAFYSCTSIEELTIPDTVTKIGVRAFSDCSALQSLSLGTENSQLETIGQSAFNNCQLLTGSDNVVTIPDSVKTIGTAAFYNCMSAEFKLGSSVETIGDYAFYNCDSIHTLNVPASVKSIGKYAFRECTNMNSLVLPSTVETIGEHAFNGCVNMTVYTDLEEIPMAWNGRWNSSSCFVVTGCELSDDKTYVVSVTVTEDTFKNASAPVWEPDPENEGELIDVNPYSAKAPVREGLRAIGWATAPDGEVVYKIGEIANAPVGTTLYPVWTEYVPVIKLIHNVEGREPDEITVALGGTLTFPEGFTAPENHILLGFCIDSEMNIEFPADTPIRHDMTLYCVWLELSEELVAALEEVLGDLSVMDTNNDGIITLEELEAAAEEVENNTAE